jgi:hypothetical protein
VEVSASNLFVGDVALSTAKKRCISLMEQLKSGISRNYGKFGNSGVNF